MPKASLNPFPAPCGTRGWQIFFVRLVISVLFWRPLLSAQPASVFFCLTNALQVRGLDQETAKKHLPVRMSGVVTYYDAPLFNLFFQDGTAGIFVLVAPGIGTNITTGQTIELEGVCDEGDYAPIVKASVLRTVGYEPLPAPRRVSIDQLFTGLEDSQWIEVSGVVRSATILDGRHYLNLGRNGQSIMVYVKDLTEAETAGFINATIRVRCVCYSRYNMKRQLRVPWLAVSSLADVVVEQLPPGEPKEVSIARLAQFNSDGYYGNLVAVSGSVTLQKRDGTLFIQDQNYGLCVHVAQPAPLTPGDRVMVSGYTALGQYVPILQDATVQLQGGGEPPQPLAADLTTLLHSPETYDGVLIQLKASLINLVESAGRETLVLQCSNSIFTASLENTLAAERFNTLKLGSQIRLTGVFAAQSPEKWIPGVAQSREILVSTIPDSPPESVQMLLRSHADVVVVREPPWWTLSRLLWAIGIMTLVLLAAVAWVIALGRRVRQQTRIIEEKIRRAGVLEERDRIAREFHDTLEQELAAITIQLDAVEAQLNGSPATVRRLLQLARNMSRRSLTEARRSVWDLRSHLLENGDLAAALAEMAAPFAAGSGVEISVKSTGAPRKLPTVTEHNLLRITQEAIANALKHSQTELITVDLSFAPAQVQLRVCDRGGGFDLRTAGQASSGHFGLLDMRERAEKIGARFSLSSHPGKGTEILLIIIDAENGMAPHPPEPQLDLE